MLVHVLCVSLLVSSLVLKYERAANNLVSQLEIFVLQVRSRFEQLKKKKEAGDPIDHVADGTLLCGSLIDLDYTNLL